MFTSVLVFVYVCTQRYSALSHILSHTGTLRHVPSCRTTIFCPSFEHMKPRFDWSQPCMHWYWCDVSAVILRSAHNSLVSFLLFFIPFFIPAFSFFLPCRTRAIACIARVPPQASHQSLQSSVRQTTSMCITTRVWILPHYSYMHTYIHTHHWTKQIVLFPLETCFIQTNNLERLSNSIHFHSALHHLPEMHAFSPLLCGHSCYSEVRVECHEHSSVQCIATPVLAAKLHGCLHLVHPFCRRERCCSIMIGQYFIPHLDTVAK